MKSVRKLLISSLMLVTFTAEAGNQFQAGEYKVDPMHSKVGFEVPHLVISSVEGSFTKVDGQIILDNNFQKSKVTASAVVDSIDTGVKDRDDHLKSADFFDSKNHPQLTFTSSSLQGNPDAFKMTGALTIRGNTKTVVFDTKHLGNVKDAYGNERAAFLATTEIDRKDFGLVWNKLVEAGPVVGEKIKIELKIQGVLSQAVKTASNSGE